MSQVSIHNDRDSVNASASGLSVSDTASYAVAVKNTPAERVDNDSQPQRLHVV